MASGAPRAAIDIGRVIQRGFQTIGRQFVAFVALSLLLSALPAVLMQWFVPVRPEQIEQLDFNFVFNPFFWLSILVTIVAGYMLQAALVRASIRDLRGERVDLGATLVDSLRLLLPMIGLAIVVSFGVVLGFILLFVPGIILFIMWVVAVPVLVEEGRGVFGSMSRSAELTKGYRWWIFLLLIFYMMAASMVGGASGVMAMPAETRPLATGVNILVSTLVAMVSAAMTASLYVELRMLNEGGSEGRLADIFA